MSMSIPSIANVCFSARESERFAFSISVTKLGSRDQ
jgi:hypothetical protein